MRFYAPNILKVIPNFTSLGYLLFLVILSKIFVYCYFEKTSKLIKSNLHWSKSKKLIIYNHLNLSIVACVIYFVDLTIFALSFMLMILKQSTIDKKIKRWYLRKYLLFSDSSESVCMCGNFVFEFRIFDYTSHGLAVWIRFLLDALFGILLTAHFHFSNQSYVSD